MLPSKTRGPTAALIVALTLAGCRSAGPSRTVQGSPEADHGHAATVGAAARADSGRQPYTEADVHFMSAMIGHHAQAIVMSRMAPSHDAGPSVQTLAERIINAQHDEIATAQSWLRDRGQPVPDAAAGPMMMKMGGVEHEMTMPGMLTEAQMRQLDAARGAEFDRLFLTFMIQHHRGAVAMVKQLFDSYGAALDDTVFKFASDVNVDQTTEIARMERMLAARLFQGRAP